VVVSAVVPAPAVELVRAGVRGRLSPVDLRVDRGVTALVGGNGSGKSTILALVAGRLPPTEGQVRVGGALAGTPAAAAIRADVPQRVAFPGRARVAEVLGVAMAARGVDAAEADEAIEKLAIRALLHRFTGRLSGGERQRVALAAALMGRPRVWLLDEPAASLDRDGLARLADWVRAHAAAGGTVLVSVHRDEEVAAYAPRRVVHLEAGRIARVDEVGQVPIP
jgi:ABC-2 type transport system ATP-binding protein